jgi:hypothetical protein
MKLLIIMNELKVFQKTIRKNLSPLKKDISEILRVSNDKLSTQKLDEIYDIGV